MNRPSLSLPQLPSVFSLCLLVAVLCSCSSENNASRSLGTGTLEAAYQAYKEVSLTQRRFKHGDIVSLLKNRKGILGWEELGKSVQGREIYQLSYGIGPVKVMLWSQMHGNESTATMALFDLFNFLEGENDGFDSIRNLLQEKLAIRFIPMLNPDGAEVFQRRNALGIDINRDAIQETSPEAALLKAARESFKPAFGFNLHDQQIYYNVSGNGKPATISVLAPAFNPETEVNEVRENSMKLIVGVNKLLQQFIPGQVGKYDDAFEPRAFGDNFQKWGTSTVLIESGGYPGDREKQFIRKLNFMLILNALYEIATDAYSHYTVEDYNTIPENDLKLMDLLIHDVSIEQNGKNYLMDLGIKRLETENKSGYDYAGTLAEVGDLSVYFGYQEIQALGLEFKTGNIWKGRYSSIEEISEEKALELLQKGYMAVRVAKLPQIKHHLPLVVVKDEKDFKSGHKIGQAANFFLKQNDELVYAVVNGSLINLKNPVTGK